MNIDDFAQKNIEIRTILWYTHRPEPKMAPIESPRAQLSNGTKHVSMRFVDLEIEPIYDFKTRTFFNDPNPFWDDRPIF